MSLEGKVWSLLNVSSVVSKVGANVVTAGVTTPSIYPNKIDQGAVLPAIVYIVISDIPQNVVDGSKPSLRKARVQVDCYALNLDEAIEAADAVEEMLGWKTEVGFASSMLDRTSGYDDASQYHRVRMDFSMWRNQ